MSDWYYIGHYGQLGPLTREQIDELIQGGVIARETFVWKNGMPDWVAAASCPDLFDAFRAAEPFAAPPPPPGSRPVMPPASAPPAQTSASLYRSEFSLAGGISNYPSFSAIRSDRSRTTAGVLQLFLPGVGRMYLGYLAYGVIQLVLTIATCGLLGIWSFIDGIIILTGGVKLDGYGRHISD